MRLNAMLLALGMVAVTGCYAQPIDVAGVRFERTAQVGGTLLQLNGAGIRYKVVFKVYAAGLYLSVPARTTAAVLADVGPKRIHVVLLREIDGAELGKLFTRGIEANASRDLVSKLIPGLIRMSEVFALKKKLTPGESFTFDWVPGKGMQIAVDGKPAGEPIVEPQFYAAVLKLWLGDVPADRQLKETLLGGASASRGTID